MKVPVITAETGRELNALTQSINPLLFWTCNYEPTLSYAINEDADFLAGIQDLYKFAIDTNCVLKGIAFNRPSCICPDLLSDGESKDLRETIDLVQTLRSVIDHNQSNYDGKLSSSRLDDYISWIRSILGKSEPTCIEDFGKLNDALKEIGNTLVTSSRKIIKRLAKRPDINAIAERWIDTVLKWYCSGTRQELYRSQLSDYYLAKACACIPNFKEDINSVELRRAVNRWISLQAMGQFEVPLKKLEAERREIVNAFESPSSQELVLRENYPKEFELVTENRNERLKEIDSETERIKAERSAYQAKCGNNKIDYFFNSERLNKQFQETLIELQKEQAGQTLLPQDFLQFDIERIFSIIRLP